MKDEKHPTDENDRRKKRLRKRGIEEEDEEKEEEDEYANYSKKTRNLIICKEYKKSGE
jgi:hypothetical protein